MVIYIIYIDQCEAILETGNNLFFGEFKGPGLFENVHAFGSWRMIIALWERKSAYVECDVHANAADSSGDKAGSHNLEHLIVTPTLRVTHLHTEGLTPPRTPSRHTA